MLIFYLKEFNPALRTMVVGYDKKGHKSVIQYFQQTLTFSYSPREISKVIGVPNKGCDATKNPNKDDNGRKEEMGKIDVQE